MKGVSVNAIFVLLSWLPTRVRAECADARPYVPGDADACQIRLLDTVSCYILLPLLLIFLVNLLQSCLFRLRHRSLQAFLDIIH